jgi:hypothetical protein
MASGGGGIGGAQNISVISWLNISQRGSSINDQRRRRRWRRKSSVSMWLMAGGGGSWLWRLGVARLMAALSANGISWRRIGWPAVMYLKINGWQSKKVSSNERHQCGGCMKIAALEMK